MAKLNLTVQRKAILDVIQQSHDHPAAADIIERLRGKGFNFAYGTVYNSLRYLTDAGLSASSSLVRRLAATTGVRKSISMSCAANVGVLKK